MQWHIYLKTSLIYQAGHEQMYAYIASSDKQINPYIKTNTSNYLIIERKND